MVVNMQIKDRATYLIQEKSITKTEKIIPAMTDEALQIIKCMKKCKCPGEDGMIIDLIKEKREEFAKMLPK